MDAEDGASFYQMLDELEAKWKEKEEETLGCLPGFHDLFCLHKVDGILSGMLKSVREEAGLGFPPVRFTTNASESINAMIKRKVNFTKK